MENKTSCELALGEDMPAANKGFASGMSGKTTDLSGFGCNIHQWHDIEVVVKNKEATFYINQKEIFSKSYTKSAGLITGLVFSSNGLCEIDQIELKSLDGKVVYESGFNN